MAAPLRSGPQLDQTTLERYAETLKPPFRRALGSGRVDIMAPPQGADAADPLAGAVARGRALFDEAGGRLLIPLISNGRCLAVLAVHDVKADSLTPAVGPFLASLVETALENVRLRLAADVDPVSGLFNEAVLDQNLTTAVSRLQPVARRDRPAMETGPAHRLGLALVEVDTLYALRERHGRALADQAMALVASQLQRQMPEALCLARLGGSLAVCWEDNAGNPRRTAAALLKGLADITLQTPQGPLWRVNLLMGAAFMGPEDCRGLAADAAAVLKARALRALAAARRTGPGQLTAYEDIARGLGRVMRILPLGRVLLNIGRADGVLMGQRFQATAADGADVAEVVVLETAEDESTALVQTVADPARPPRPGDGLVMLDPAAGAEAAEAQDGPVREVAVGSQRFQAAVDEETGLITRLSLAQVLDKLCAVDEPMAGVLVRIEGLEGLRQTSGRVGAEALMGSLAAEAAKIFPPQAILGRHSPDTMAVLIPGATADEAAGLAAGLLENMAGRTERPVRAGAASHPCPGWQPDYVLDNAAKALIHAGFLEPFSAVAFDAVSLNISGDVLFGQGLINEAVAEYEKALLLNDAEPNVHNSLGVCYAQLGQMDRAMKHFNLAAKAAPDDFMAHFNMGCALAAVGRAEDAAASLERSLELQPDHGDSLLQLGLLAKGRGDIAGAADYLGRAAKAGDCRGGVHRHLGEVLLAQGRLAEAEEAFSLAVKHQPREAAGLAGLSGLYLERGANLEIALSLAQRAAALEPDQARHVLLAADIMEAQGRPSETADLLKDLVGDKPDDAYIQLRIGRLRLIHGDADAARRHFTKALELDSGLGEARQALAGMD